MDYYYPVEITLVCVLITRDIFLFVQIYGAYNNYNITKMFKKYKYTHKKQNK